MNKHTGQLLNEYEHIRQSITDILLTQKGTRLMRREYGSDLFNFIDRPTSRAVMLQLAVAAVMAIDEWEPRVRVKQAEMRTHERQVNRVELVLTLALKSQAQEIKLDPITIR